MGNGRCLIINEAQDLSDAVVSLLLALVEKIHTSKYDMVVFTAMVDVLELKNDPMNRWRALVTRCQRPNLADTDSPVFRQEVVDYVSGIAAQEGIRAVDVEELCEKAGWSIRAAVSALDLLERVGEENDYIRSIIEEEKAKNEKTDEERDWNKWDTIREEYEERDLSYEGMSMAEFASVRFGVETAPPVGFEVFAPAEAEESETRASIKSKLDAACDSFIAAPPRLAVAARKVKPARKAKPAVEVVESKPVESAPAVAKPESAPVESAEFIVDPSETNWVEARAALAQPSPVQHVAEFETVTTDFSDIGAGNESRHSTPLLKSCEAPRIKQSASRVASIRIPGRVT